VEHLQHPGSAAASTSGVPAVQLDGAGHLALHRQEELEIPSIYFVTAPVFERDGILIADNEFVTRADDELIFDARVRYRTVGDMTCTGAVESRLPRSPGDRRDRGHQDHRARPDQGDDRTSEAAMEDRKREGYF